MDYLVYVDHRPIFIPYLENYKNGLTPKRGDEIKVTLREKKNLLKQKNGKLPCFEEKKKTFPKKELIVEEQ